MKTKYNFSNIIDSLSNDKNENKSIKMIINFDIEYKSEISYPDSVEKLNEMFLFNHDNNSNSNGNSNTNYLKKPLNSKYNIENNFKHKKTLISYFRPLTKTEKKFVLFLSRQEEIFNEMEFNPEVLVYIIDPLLNEFDNNNSRHDMYNIYNVKEDNIKVVYLHTENITTIHNVTLELNIPIYNKMGYISSQAMIGFKFYCWSLMVSNSRGGENTTNNQSVQFFKKTVGFCKIYLYKIFRDLQTKKKIQYTHRDIIESQTFAHLEKGKIQIHFNNDFTKKYPIKWIMFNSDQIIAHSMNKLICKSMLDYNNNNNNNRLNSRTTKYRPYSPLIKRIHCPFSTSDFCRIPTTQYTRILPSKLPKYQFFINLLSICIYKENWNIKIFIKVVGDQFKEYDKISKSQKQQKRRYLGQRGLLKVSREFLIAINIVIQACTLIPSLLQYRSDFMNQNKSNTKYWDKVKVWVGEDYGDITETFGDDCEGSAALVYKIAKMFLKLKNQLLLELLPNRKQRRQDINMSKEYYILLYYAIKILELYIPFITVTETTNPSFKSSDYKNFYEQQGNNSSTNNRNSIKIDPVCHTFVLFIPKNIFSYMIIYDKSQNIEKKLDTCLECPDWFLPVLFGEGTAPSYPEITPYQYVTDISKFKYNDCYINDMKQMTIFKRNLTRHFPSLSNFTGTFFSDNLQFSYQNSNLKNIYERQRFSGFYLSFIEGYTGYFLDNGLYFGDFLIVNEINNTYGCCAQDVVFFAYHNMKYNENIQIYEMTNNNKRSCLRMKIKCFYTNKEMTFLNILLKKRYPIFTLEIPTNISYLTRGIKMELSQLCIRMNLVLFNKYASIFKVKNREIMYSRKIKEMLLKRKCHRIIYIIPIQHIHNFINTINNKRMETMNTELNIIYVDYKINPVAQNERYKESLKLIIVHFEIYFLTP